MKVLYFCVYDNSLQRANFPFVAHDVGEAKQVVRNMLLSLPEDNSSILLKIKHHCVVRLCGAFDLEAGVFDLDCDVGKDVFKLSDFDVPERTSE